MFLISGVIDILIDLLILLLPIQRVFKLQLPIRTRVAVAGIFALGGFVIITNSLRIHAIYQPGSQSGKFFARAWHLVRVTDLIAQWTMQRATSGLISTS